MYGVLCESDIGVDPFGNPSGKPILLEAVGDSLSLYEAQDIAKKTKGHGKFGRVMVVELVIHEVLF